MPGLDGTGPRGQGPRTGRGFGNCRGGSGLFKRPTPVNGGKVLTEEEQKKLLLDEKKTIEQKLADLEK